MANLIHIYHNNQQEGPYSPEQLRDMMASGTVTPITLAWREGMSDWAPLETIMSTFQSTMAPTAPSPPARADAVSQANVASPPVTATGPKGVGGWLLFFCVGLTILSPLFSLGQISMNWEQAQPAFDQFPTLKTAVMWENAGSIALVVYGFIVGCIIWSGNPNGRRIAKKFLLIRFFGFIGIEFVAVVIMGDMPSQVVTSVIGAGIGAVFREGLWFLIWWLYFKKSKRVRNTYGAI